MMDTKKYRKRAGLCSIVFYLLIALLLPAGKAVGQVKKELRQPDYKRWSFLISDNLSAKGNWASYRVKNPSGDTLFARNIQSGKQFVISAGNEGRFYKEEYFAGIKGDTLVVIHLKSGQTRKHPDCQFFDFNRRSGQLFTFSKYKDSGHTLQVFSPEGAVQMTLEGVTSWKWNSGQSKVAVAYRRGNGHAVAVIDGTQGNVTPAMTADKPFSGLAWGGDFVSFIREDNGSGRIYLFDSEKKILKECGAMGGKGIPEGMKLLGDFDFTVVSNDGKRVFFAVSEPPSTAPESLVQVWRADDKQLYPRKQMYGDVYLQHKFGLWQVESDKVLMLSDRQYPLASGSASGSHALLWDPMQYEPQTDYDGPYDMYLMDLATAARTKIISNQEGNSSGFYLDPHGDYLYYAKDYHWWAYDIRRQLHRNLTQALNVEFDNRQYDRAGKRPMYGAAGFAAGGASLIVYDQYDCWELFPDGSKARKLTGGRADHTTYRLAETEPGHSRRMHGYENLLGVYDTGAPLVFIAASRTGKFEGYYSRTGIGQMQLLYKADQQLESLVKASGADVFTFAAQRYDLPPQLLSVKPGRKASLVYQSNKQQHEYHWGRSEIVHYQVGGKKLTGVLIFPADFQKDKNYPMIVSIYEKQSYLLNAYVNPSAYNMTGFNPANLSAKGYFILLPDIAYRMREMGDSATDCVLAAVDSVIKDYPVDPKRLGLTGHSFGGYETDYIITQTGRFKAALSGAALTDLVSSYLYVGGNHGRPDFWRFEHQQQRMEKSLFEGLSHYLDNSPILKADRVSTPLLSWTGENDRHVNYMQSVEFYLALRRMGKEHTLLVYPGEEHVILDREKQKDLTSRFEAWFDKYLMP